MTPPNVDFGARYRPEDGLANELAGLPQDAAAPCPPRAALEPVWRKAA